MNTTYTLHKSALYFEKNPHNNMRLHYDIQKSDIK